MSNMDNLYKLFGPRSGPTKCCPDLYCPYQYTHIHSEQMYLCEKKKNCNNSLFAPIPFVALVQLQVRQYMLAITFTEDIKNNNPDV